MNWKRPLLALTCFVSAFWLSALLLRHSHSARETQQMVRKSTAILEQSIKRLDAMAPPRFVPVHTYPDGTVLMADPALLPDNKLPALNTKEAWEIKGGDYPAPQDMRRDR